MAAWSRRGDMFMVQHYFDIEELSRMEYWQLHHPSFDNMPAVPKGYLPAITAYCNIWFSILHASSCRSGK